MRHQSGGILLESLATLTLLLIMLPTLANLVDSGYREVKKRAVADHLSEVLDATAEYVRANHETLAATATASVAAPITLTQLLPFLPDGFQSRNAWGQQYGAYVLEPSAGTLQALVLTFNGRTVDTEFANLDVPSAAALVGGAGGYIPTGDLPGQTSTELRGSYGGWVVSLAGTNIPNPGPGHLGGMVSFTAADLAQDYLYRVAVPGHDELNEMSTELDMTDHAIRGISELQFESHTLASIDPSGFCSDPAKNGRITFDPDVGFYTCRNSQVEVLLDSGNSLALQNATVAVNGQLIDKPTCPTGTGQQPEIFVSPSIVAQGTDASGLLSVQSWAVDQGDQWRVYLRVLTTDSSAGWVYPSGDHGRIMVLTTCN